MSHVEIKLLVPHDRVVYSSPGAGPRLPQCPWETQVAASLPAIDGGFQPARSDRPSLGFPTREAPRETSSLRSTAWRAEGLTHTTRQNKEAAGVTGQGSGEAVTKLPPSWSS